MIQDDVESKGFWINWKEKLKPKVMSLDELKAKLVKAEKSYKACGCKVYLEEIRVLTKSIQDLEASVKNT